jgi:hypothetical protein
LKGNIAKQLMQKIIEGTLCSSFRSQTSLSELFATFSMGVEVNITFWDFYTHVEILNNKIISRREG